MPTIGIDDTLRCVAIVVLGPEHHLVVTWGAWAHDHTVVPAARDVDRSRHCRRAHLVVRVMLMLLPGGDVVVRVARVRAIDLVAPAD